MMKNSRAISLSLLMLAAALALPARAKERAMPQYLVGKEITNDLKSLEAAGRIMDAEKWIDARLGRPESSKDERESLVVERERLRRLRRDFSLSRDEMLAKVREAIPDAQKEDIENWRSDGMLQWVKIDGEYRFFRREPSNLFRFCDEARERRDAARASRTRPTSPTLSASVAAPASIPSGDPAANVARSFTLADHAAEVLRLAGANEGSKFEPVRMKVRHNITVDPGVVPAGKTVRCWMPFPQEYQQQTDVRLLYTSPTVNQVAPNGTGQRTIYLERPAGATGKPTVFVAEYEYTCAAYAPSLSEDKIGALSPDDPIFKEYTAERTPHIVFNDEARKLARDIVGSETNPYVKAQKIWRWINDNVRYCSEMEYSLMPSVTEKILAERRGDCGVQALLFITLCRISGVPARWQSGWVTRPGHWNLHDWAEFYVAPYGWLPADPSIGYFTSDDAAVHDFLFANMDSYRMIANLDYETAFTPPKKFWRSDPVDNQRGEVEWDGGNLYYDDWDFHVDVQTVK